MIEISTTPNDHFTIGPNRRVKFAFRGRVGGAGSCPTVGLLAGKPHAHQTSVFFAHGPAGPVQMGS